jgi:hypothetical protein
MRYCTSGNDAIQALVEGLAAELLQQLVNLWVARPRGSPHDREVFTLVCLE